MSQDRRPFPGDAMTVAHADDADIPCRALPALLSAEEVRGTFRLTERALFDWDKRGWLTPTRIGRQKFYRFDEVLRVAEQGTPRKRRKNKA
jgi:hypothetical protein